MGRAQKYQGAGAPSGRWRPHWLWVLLIVALMPGVFLRTASAGAPDVTAAATWETHPAGDRIRVAVSIPPGVHINADAGQMVSTEAFVPVPTTLGVSGLPPGVAAAAPIFPRAHAVRVSFSTEPLMVFEGQVMMIVPLTGRSPSAESTAGVQLSLTYQACDARICYFPATLTLSPKRSAQALPAVAPPAAAAAPTQSADPTVGFHLFGWRWSLDTAGGPGRLLLVIMAALGGILLNLTPCVLPLIPIKIIGLAAAAEEHPGRCLALGTAMAAGIVAFWGVLGILVFTVSGLTAANQLFHYPWFTITVGAVIAVMAMGLLRPAAVALPAAVYRFNPAQDRLTGSFLLGILAAVLSTPCTAPFMGAAVAWAVTRPPIQSLTVFLAIGTGMALPYLILAARPGLARRLPKTGPANQLLKETMGWLMLAAAAYFAGTGISGLTAAPGESPGRGYWWVVMGSCAMAGLWTAFRYRSFAATPLKRRLGTTVGLAAAAMALFIGARLADPGDIQWIAYSPERYTAVMARQRPVVLVFTAEWCLNCKALEQQVYRDPAVVRLFEEGRAVPMKVDLTATDAAGRRFLQSTGRLTIPLVVVRAPDGRDTLVADFYTAAELIGAVDRAQPPP